MRLPGWLMRKNRHTAEHESDPDAASLARQVRAIEIRARRLVDDLFLGEYHAVFRGRGIEFDELRPYVPGDDVRDIDWKALARSGEPYIRRYREDREVTVVFMVDISGSQVAGALPRSKKDIAAELCAVLSLAAIRNNDRVGLLLFAGAPERYLRPGRGSGHVLRVIREVLSARASTPGTGLGDALEYITGVLRRRATVFLISDFLAGDYSQQLRAVAMRHDLVAVRVREPLDGVLPPAGLVRIADAETGQSADVDASDRRVRAAFQQHIRELDQDRLRVFGAAGIECIDINVGEDYVPPLLRFFRRRAERVA